MSKENPIKESAAPGKESLSHVRVRTGGVHFQGARIITTLTTDASAINVAGSNVVVCNVIRFHPAGIYFEASEAEGGGAAVIPYVNVEIATIS